MKSAWRTITTNWPLFAAIAAAAALAVAHASQTFAHLAPCELCLRQRMVFWVALAVGLAGWIAPRVVRRPGLTPAVNLLLALVFLFGAGLAAYHAGVEWKWWPGPTSCTGSGAANAGALAELLKGAKVARPACDVAAWRGLGLSMAGWNVLYSLVLTVVSVGSIGSRRRGLEPL